MAAEQISSTASSAEQEDLGMLLRLPTPTEDNDLSVMRPSTDESATNATVLSAHVDGGDIEASFSAWAEPAI